MGNDQDPVGLHKYLYGHADPVLYTDSSGNMVSLGGLMSDIDVAATLTSSAIGGYSIGSGGMAMYERFYAEGAVDIALGFMRIGVQGVNLVFGPTNILIRQKYHQFPAIDITK